MFPRENIVRRRRDGSAPVPGRLSRGRRPRSRARPVWAITNLLARHSTQGPQPFLKKYMDDFSPDTLDDAIVRLETSLGGQRDQIAVLASALSASRVLLVSMESTLADLHAAHRPAHAPERPGQWVTGDRSAPRPRFALADTQYATDLNRFLPRTHGIPGMCGDHSRGGVLSAHPEDTRASIRALSPRAARGPRTTSHSMESRCACWLSTTTAMQPAMATYLGVEPIEAPAVFSYAVNSYMQTRQPPSELFALIRLLAH